MAADDRITPRRRGRRSPGMPRQCGEHHAVLGARRDDQRAPPAELRADAATRSPGTSRVASRNFGSRPSGASLEQRAEDFAARDGDDQAAWRARWRRRSASSAAGSAAAGRRRYTSPGTTSAPRRASSSRSSVRPPAPFTIRMRCAAQVGEGFEREQALGVRRGLRHGIDADALLVEGPCRRATDGGDARACGARQLLQRILHRVGAGVDRPVEFVRCQRGAARRVEFDRLDLDRRQQQDGVGAGVPQHRDERSRLARGARHHDGERPRARASRCRCGLVAQAIEQRACARRLHPGREPPPERLGVGRVAAFHVAVDLAAVRRAHEAVHDERAALERRRAPRSASGSCRSSVCAKARSAAGARTTARDAARPAPRGWLASSSRHSMPITPWPTAGSESSRSSTCVMRLPRPRRSSPAQASRMASSSPSSSRRKRVSTLPRSSSSLRSGRACRSCAWRRGLDVPTRAPLRQVGETLMAQRQERVVRIGARQHRRDAEARRQLARHVLHRVHGDVGAAFLHRDLEFLDEQALAADLRERAVLHAVALRAHRHELDGQVGMRGPQQRGDVLGLPERELAAAGGDAERLGQGDLQSW